VPGITHPHLGRAERYLLCFSGLPLAGVFVLCVMQRVEPNWPAAFYISAIVLLVGAAIGGVSLPVWPRIVEKSLRHALVVGAITAAIACVIPFGLGLEGTRLDATVRLRGWRSLSERVAQRRAELPRPERTFVISAAGRAAASELAFYLPDQPQVYLWTPGDVVLSQYDLWGGPHDKAGWDALIVTGPGTPAPAELQAAFERVEDHGQVAVRIGGDRHLSYHLWRAHSFRRWPDKPHVAARTVESRSLR
jgi:hypothetical protein